MSGRLFLLLVTIADAGTYAPSGQALLVAATAVAGIVLLVGFRWLRVHAQLLTLRETDARYNQLLALLPDAVIIHADGNIVFTNMAASELLGQPTPQALVGQPLETYVHQESIDAVSGIATLQEVTNPARAPRPYARMRDTTGHAIDTEVVSIECVYRARPARMLIVRDITAQLRYERDLHALALVDELTGLQNRRAFTLFAEQELARARRHGDTPMLVFADLDGLKSINDEHGHAEGDAAIRLVASALRSIFRETDIVARWSGDEFVALMVEGTGETASRLAERLAAAIAAQRPVDQPYAVSASIGAIPLDPALHLRDAMQRADAELYEQKKRNRRSKIRPTPLGLDVIKHQR